MTTEERLDDILRKLAIECRHMSRFDNEFEQELPAYTAEARTALLQLINETHPDIANIQDWTNKGLESDKPEVWFRCLQLINDCLTHKKKEKDDDN